MRVIYPNLIRAMKAQKVSRSQLAAELGLSQQALSRRFRGISEWKLHEIVKICELLGSVNAVHLFLRLNTKTF